MPLPFNPEKMRARAMAHKLQVHENIVRNRLQHGGPLTAEEVRDGIRLTHDEYLYLVQMAMPSLNHALED